MTKSKIERLRLQYRPERITVLFVGEAPPASDTFFYRGNSGLTNYMRDALGGPKGDIEFLNWFKARGWYLDDLVTTPIDDLRDRRKQCREAGASMAARIAEYQPAVIVCLLKSISDDVEIAASKANSKAPLILISPHLDIAVLLSIQRSGSSAASGRCSCFTLTTVGLGLDVSGDGSILPRNFDIFGFFGSMLPTNSGLPVLPGECPAFEH